MPSILRDGLPQSGAWNPIWASRRLGRDPQIWATSCCPPGCALAGTGSLEGQQGLQMLASRRWPTEVHAGPIPKALTFSSVFMPASGFRASLLWGSRRTVLIFAVATRETKICSLAAGLKMVSRPSPIFPANLHLNRNKSGVKIRIHSTSAPSVTFPHLVCSSALAQLSDPTGTATSPHLAVGCKKKIKWLGSKN